MGAMQGEREKICGVKPAFTVRRLAAGDTHTTEYREMRIALWPDCAKLCDSEIDQILNDKTWVVFAGLVGRGAEERAIGFAEVHLREFAEGTDATPVPFLEGWFVKEEYRRIGVGRALVAAAEGWARSAGFRVIASDANPDNTISLAAHAELGFREVERLVCFVKQLE